MKLVFSDDTSINITNIQNRDDVIDIEISQAAEETPKPYTEMSAIFNDTNKTESIAVLDDSENTTAVYSGYTTPVYIRLDQNREHEYIYRISLQNTSFAEKLNRAVDSLDKKYDELNEQINPVIDVDRMTIEELRAYKTGLFGKACSEDIFAGIDVETTEGVEHFSLTNNDQSNISTLAYLITNSDINASLPYHADGKFCRLFSGVEILTIFMYAQMYITEKVTYCNMLNMMSREEADFITIKNMEYGMDLYGKYLNTYNEIIASAQETAQAFIEKFMPTPEEPVEEVESEEVDGE